MTCPDTPRVPVGPPAGIPLTWTADAERALDRPEAIAAPAWADWPLAYAASGADETMMNSPCL